MIMDDQRVEQLEETRGAAGDGVLTLNSETYGASAGSGGDKVGGDGVAIGSAAAAADQINAAHVGQYSDQHNIDADCERLLRNTKKQVKQMMEEAVTKKFIHEASSSIISLCVAVDACLSHGLKRRALGLFKTNSSTALIQKVAKNYRGAQEVLDMVGSEERKILSEQQQQQQRRFSSANQQQQQDGKSNALLHKSPIKQTASNSSVHKRYMWIKYALIEKKLVGIIEHLAENSSKYYEPDALLSNYLCAQILSSLLLGFSALEISRSKTNDYYQFDDPTADELLKRHKLANPIACLCNKQQQLQQQQQRQQQPQPRYLQHSAADAITHNQLSRSATDGLATELKRSHLASSYNSLQISSTAPTAATKNGKRGRSHEPHLVGEPQQQQQEERQTGASSLRPPSPGHQEQQQQQQVGQQMGGGGGAAASGRKEGGRRRPLSLKTSVKRGTIVTDCHHYSCQEISERQQTRGYSLVCTHSNGLTSTPSYCDSPAAGGGGANQDWSLWSPRMLHETLHQNSRSSLLYAKNNVLLETQTHKTMPGYLSLHQTSSDLILKWIPNQMINGSQINTCQSAVAVDGGDLNDDETAESQQTFKEQTTAATDLAASSNPCGVVDQHQQKQKQKQQQQQQQQQTQQSSQIAMESSYLDLVVSLPVSRIVLLHCQFGKKATVAAAAAPPTAIEQPLAATATTTTTNVASGFKGLLARPSGEASETGGCHCVSSEPTNSLPTSQTDQVNTMRADAQLSTSDPQLPPSKAPSTEETLIFVEADGVQKAPFKFPKGGLRLFLSCLESGLRPGKFLDPAIRFEEGWPDPLESPPPVTSVGDRTQLQKDPGDALGLDSPSMGGNGSGGSSSSGAGGGKGEASSLPAATSRLDTFFRRLPSLQRKASPKASEPSGPTESAVQTGAATAVGDSSRAASPESFNNNTTTNSTELPQQQQQQQQQPRSPGLPTNNYVYRIVSVQQPDWPLQTPPHSALSVASSSSGSLGQNGVRQASASAVSSGNKFRWSLSKLARFSTIYTNSGSTASSISSAPLPATNQAATSGGLAGHSSATVAGGSMSCGRDDTLDQTTTTTSDSIDGVPLYGGNGGTMNGLDEQNRSMSNAGAAGVDGGARDLARIEAKLHDLTKSTSDDILALRTQSVQTLCDSMRRQIVARAFYGWLVHCRKVKIIRAHLMKLIKEDEWCFLASPTHDDLEASLEVGLTRERWEALMRSAATGDAQESDLCREANQLVYYGGIESDELRKQVWPYLLEHYKFTDTKEKRLARDQMVREAYESCGRDWIRIERVVKQRDNELLAANIAKAASKKSGQQNQGGGSTSDAADCTTKGHSTGGDHCDNSDSSVRKETANSTLKENSQEELDSNHDDNDDEGETANVNGAHEMNHLADGPMSCSKQAEVAVVGAEQPEEKEVNKDTIVVEVVGAVVGSAEENKDYELVGGNDDDKAAATTKASDHSGNRGTRKTASSRKAKEAKLAAAAKRKRRRPRLESTGSVGSDASITDQFGNNIHRIDKDVQRCDRNFWYFKEEKNLDKLRNIMYSYVWQHLDVGYVQGMCDLAAPFLVIFDDEILAFSCFSQLMKRMVANFPHGHAMDQHFESLKYLMQVLDPKLFEILQSNGDYTHFYFCYRWLLLDFKRELAYEDVYRVWETIWSARRIVTDHFVVFMALAMVRYYRDIIIENNMDFTDTIKFFNEMAERHDTKSIIALARDCIVELRSLIKA